MPIGNGDPFVWSNDQSHEWQGLDDLGGRWDIWRHAAIRSVRLFPRKSFQLPLNGDFDMRNTPYNCIRSG